jgi:hypothetical protein
VRSTKIASTSSKRIIIDLRGELLRGECSNHPHLSCLQVADVQLALGGNDLDEGSFLGTLWSVQKKKASTVGYSLALIPLITLLEMVDVSNN